MSRTQVHLRMALFGLLLGFALSCMGFTDFGEVHAMFTFQSFRLYLTFCGGVALTMMGFLVFARGKRLARRGFHKGIIPGGLLFGIGWGLTGACPAGAMVQLGEGRVLAALTLFGIALGAWVYPIVHRRIFPWSIQSCDA